MLPEQKAGTPGGGCLRVGTRVRMENRVVGLTGFWPGTPMGAPGSLGPRGGPGKAAFCCRHFEDFSLAPRKSRYRLARANPSPPSMVGYPGSCGERFKAMALHRVGVV